MKEELENYFLLPFSFSLFSEKGKEREREIRAENFFSEGEREKEGEGEGEEKKERNRTICKTFCLCRQNDRSVPRANRQ